jgi:hypothetical protein
MGNFYGDKNMRQLWLLPASNSSLYYTGSKVAPKLTFGGLGAYQTWRQEMTEERVPEKYDRLSITEVPID